MTAAARAQARLGGWGGVDSGCGWRDCERVLRLYALPLVVVGAGRGGVLYLFRARTTRSQRMVKKRKL